MLSFITLLLVIAISMLISKIATIALSRTGMSMEMARFQARSAFSGAGFTTTASEDVVRHPVRRRIVMWLIILGNAGLVSAMSSLIIGIGSESADVGIPYFKYIFLFGGAVLLILATRSKVIDRLLTRQINWILNRYSGRSSHDLPELLDVNGDYGVLEFQVESDNAMRGKSLADLRIREQGLLVLGIHREDCGYLGVPRGRDCIESGDTLVMYGLRSRIAEFYSDATKGKRKLDKGDEKREDEHEEELEEQDRKQKEEANDA